MRTLSIIAALSIACGSSTRDARSLLTEQCCCCPCSADAGVDAAPDAPPDAPAGAIDLAAPWTRTIITAGAFTGPLRGADGVAEDLEGCWWTPWEQGATVTRACRDGAGGWATEVVATHASELAMVEDVKPGDFDLDGLVDGAIAVSSPSAAAVRIAFRGMSGTITLPATQLLGPVMQVAVADLSVPPDGRLDIVFGTQKASGAHAGTIAWAENPGPALARIGVHWQRRDISPAGWPMSIVPVTGGVVVSDRASYKDAAGVVRWDLYGARFMERQPDGSWTAHRIGYPAGQCNPLPYTSPNCLKTPGDEMMLDVLTVDVGGSLDWLVVDGQSSSSQVDSRILLHQVGAGTHALIPPVSGVGHYQHAIAYDVEQLGRISLVVSTWIADSAAAADRTKSWLYWLRDNGDGTWSRGEISGAGNGVKGDNVARLGRCVIATEQVDQLGVALYCPQESL